MPDLDGHHLHLNPHHVTTLIADGRPVPLTIELGLTSACNDRCVFCAFDYRRIERPTQLDYDRFAQWLGTVPRPTSQELGPLSFHIAGDGEPTCHKDFECFVKLLSERGFAVGLTTNGTHPQKLLKVARHLTWCRFSLNAGTNEVFRRIQGHYADIEDRFRSVRAVALAMPPAHTVGVQCLVLDQPREDLERLIERAFECELDYLSFKPYSHHPQSKNEVETTSRFFLPELIKKSQPEGNLTPRLILRLIPEAKKYTGCMCAASFFWCGTSEGRFYPCAQFVGDNQWCFGDLNLQSYTEIRMGNAYRSVAAKLFSIETETCRHPCRCDHANRYMNRLTRPENADTFL